jgi:hypothetical protein
MADPPIVIKKLAANSLELENQRIRKQEQMLQDLITNPSESVKGGQGSISSTSGKVKYTTIASDCKEPEPHILGRRLETLEELEFRRMLRQGELLSQLGAQVENFGEESIPPHAVKSRYSVKGSSKGLQCILDADDEEPIDIQGLVPSSQTSLTTDTNEMNSGLIVSL